jgi:hypothetical protein
MRGRGEEGPARQKGKRTQTARHTSVFCGGRRLKRGQAKKKEKREKKRGGAAELFLLKESASRGHCS